LGSRESSKPQNIERLNLFLPGLQEAIQFKKAFQNLLCIDEPPNLNCEEVSYLRYHK
jgi:hypothetical protein